MFIHTYSLPACGRHCAGGRCTNSNEASSVTLRSSKSSLGDKTYEQMITVHGGQGSYRVSVKGATDFV